MMDAAKTEAAACSIGAIGTAANLILSAPADAAAAVAAIRGASFAVRAYASSPIAACWTTVQTIRTADRIVSLASWNDRNNGTFIGMHQSGRRAKSFLLVSGCLPDSQVVGVGGQVACCAE
jgi:hypothetical protein